MLLRKVKTGRTSSPVIRSISSRCSRFCGSAIATQMVPRTLNKATASSRSATFRGSSLTATGSIMPSRRRMAGTPRWLSMKGRIVSSCTIPISTRTSPSRKPFCEPSASARSNCSGVMISAPTSCWPSVALIGRAEPVGAVPPACSAGRRAAALAGPVAPFAGSRSSTADEFIAQSSARRHPNRETFQTERQRLSP